MLDAFEITRRWPAKRPDAIQLYAFPTPNGIKVSAMLEETGLDYEPHLVKFRDGEQKTPEFLSLNPNGKIPAIIDPNGPGGEPLPLWESGAILIYLAEKSGRFLSADPAQRHRTLQWLMWQMSGPVPMFGQFGFFHRLEGATWEDRRPFERYRDEAIRLLRVLEERLEGRDAIATDAYSIADIAMWPWIRMLLGRYDGVEALGLHAFTNVDRWYRKCMDRPASRRAVAIPGQND